MLGRGEDGRMACRMRPARGLAPRRGYDCPGAMHGSQQGYVRAKDGRREAVPRRSVVQWRGRVNAAAMRWRWGLGEGMAAVWSAALRWPSTRDRAGGGYHIGHGGAQRGRAEWRTTAALGESHTGGGAGSAQRAGKRAARQAGTQRGMGRVLGMGEHAEWASSVGARAEDEPIVGRAKKEV